MCHVVLLHHGGGPEKDDELQLSKFDATFETETEIDG